MGIQALIKIRTELSPARARELLGQLQIIDQTREDVDDLLQRNQAWYDQTYGWRDGIRTSVARLIPGSDRIRVWCDATLRDIVRRRDAYLRLLRTDMAIRLYREVHGETPNRLDDLVPEFLSEVTQDPFSGHSLIYRRTADKFVLYSVGTDGVDDGGNFPATAALPIAAGFDFDLDINLRRPNAAAGS